MPTITTYISNEEKDKFEKKCNKKKITGYKQLKELITNFIEG